MAKSTRKLKFEAAMERLDEIVEAMESGEIGIEESIARYEEAMTLATHCRRILDSVEQRIRKIQTDSSGAFSETDFDAPPASNDPAADEPDADDGDTDA